jgi:hypothetical protein
MEDIRLERDSPPVKIVLREGTLVVHPTSSVQRNTNRAVVYFIPNPGYSLEPEDTGHGLHVYFRPPKEEARLIQW